MKIYFNTSNNHKFKELEAMLPFKIHQCNISVDEIQSHGSVICQKKAIDVSKNIKDGLVITDDVSLELDGLNGFPGPFVKSFLTIGYDKIEKIVALLGRNATAHCYLSLARNGELLFSACGSVRGEIVSHNDCDNKFGFDKIFKPLGSNLTFAQMGAEEKNKISHRALAVAKILKFLKAKGFIVELK
ncbi:Inosine triphosphate pyrophosphatase [Dictyocoela roeselum]|nr:Inosine triphosphate pyrophosphatase [Dictyocoela roeselum]